MVSRPLGRQKQSVATAVATSPGFKTAGNNNNQMMQTSFYGGIDSAKKGESRRKQRMRQS